MCIYIYIYTYTYICIERDTYIIVIAVISLFSCVYLRLACLVCLLVLPRRWLGVLAILAVRVGSQRERNTRKIPEAGKPLIRHCFCT